MIKTPYKGKRFIWNLQFPRAIESMTVSARSMAAGMALCQISVQIFHLIHKTDPGNGVGFSFWFCFLRRGFST